MSENIQPDSDFILLKEERRRQRTRTFLLYEAYRETFGSGFASVLYRIGDAFFYQFKNHHAILPAEVEKIKQVMLRKVDENRALKQAHLSREEALEKLDQPGKEDTWNWVHDMDGSLPYFYESTYGLLAFKGQLSDTTSDAGVWDLIPYPPGILMLVAPFSHDQLPPFCERPTLFRSFFEASRWGMIHGASYISDVNRVIRSGEMFEFVQVAEALHARKIALIADQITLMQPRPKVVLISGPSSSGKTSFSKLLLVQLRVLGLHPKTMSLDNYYLPRNIIPVDESGDPDYETLDAIDVELFNENLIRLVAGEEIHPPILNFETHKREQGPPLKLDMDGILIVEGMHGLNPALTPHLTAPSVFKVFVSALNHLNLDKLSRVSTTDLRLIRRIVRDRFSRGYSAEDTLSRWDSVRRGEKAHIFPHQEEADVMFNSALPYELNALKPLAGEVLDEVNNPELKTEANRLKSLLDAVVELPRDWTDDYVPRTSILREFFGGSALI
ncbi:MAG: nucleoside kinase [Candidatus Electryonea clarkiae]|nr:nucleoside kinase [Candidatus Electryonea clarkiae]MDP8287565.1 nucleoside kinase [Candidatus Electryonea clarkiae]